MANSTLQSESASATVVRLPTAAHRKVRQRWSKARKADREALLRFPSIHMTPFERRCAEAAAMLTRLEMTPEMALTVAIFQTMDSIDQLKVQAFLALITGSHPDSALISLEYARFVTAPPHERGKITRHLKRMRGD